MAYTDRSGSIASGGTAQALMAAAVPNQPRKGWLLYNSSAANLYVNDVGGTAHASNGTSITIAPGAMLSTDNNDNAAGIFQGAISILGGTTAQTFVAREW